MLEFLIDNIFVEFEDYFFPLWSLSVDLFLFLYESRFLQTIVDNKKVKDAKTFNFTFRYSDVVFSINKIIANFYDWVHWVSIILKNKKGKKQKTRFPILILRLVLVFRIRHQR